MPDAWFRKSYVEHCLSIWGNPVQPSTTQISFMVYLSGIIEAKSILDVGCGMGHFRQVILNRFGDKVKYVGMDRSPEMLNVAKKYFPNDEWVLGDATTFVKPTETIVCIDVLIHQHDIEPLIKNMWNNTIKTLIFNMNCSEDYEYCRGRDGPEEFDGELIMKRMTSKNVMNVISKLEGFHTEEEIIYDGLTSVFMVHRSSL